MKKEVSLSLALLAVAGTFGLLVAYPAAAAAAVRAGLALCSKAIIPSLFPFFVLSGMLSQLGAPQLLGRIAEKPMRRLFGVSGRGCAPFILGLTGGYPVGAAATADLVREGSISTQEGERMLAFCNNTGPAFIIGAAGSGVFGSTACGALLYLSHILAAAAVGLLFSSRKPPAKAPRRPPVHNTPSLAPAFTAAVKNAAASCINICAFIIFFSVLKGLFEEIGVFSRLSGSLAVSLGLELRFVRALLTGVLELGGGIGAMAGLAANPQNLALASFLLGFGSLSVHCQTLAVLSGTHIKCARHFAGRILHGAFSASLTYFLGVLFL